MTADELVAFAEELARIAASGGGVKALADRLAGVAGCSVLIEDAQWRHVAASGTGMPSSVRSLVGDEPQKTLRSLPEGRGRTMTISSGDVRLGQISIFSAADADRCEYLVRMAAGAIAVELARDGGGQPGRVRAFWERLASGDYLDAAAAKDDAASRGIVLASHYLAIAMESESVNDRAGAADQAALGTAAAQAFRSGEASAGVVERANAILLFVPAAREIDAANARTAATLFPRTLAKRHPQIHAGVGVGTRVPFFELRSSIERAQAALTIARRLHGAGKVGIYEDLGAYPLLFQGADREALRAFARATLAPLRTYDEKHQTELERTLRLYFSVGENVKTAADRLNVHRHTVFYRLRQIGEICRCKLDDPHDQLTLRMAMAIDALTEH